MLPPMKFKTILLMAASACLCASLLLTVGCGGGEESAATNSELADLQAKAAQGDGSAAFKAGEILANDSEDSAKQVAALKWFYISRKLGHDPANMGIVTLEKTMSGDQIMTATREAENFKVAGQ